MPAHSLLSRKAPRGPPGLTSPSDGRIAINSNVINKILTIGASRYSSVLFVQCRILLEVIFAYSLSRLCMPHNPIKANMAISEFKKLSPVSVNAGNGSHSCIVH